MAVQRERETGKQPTCRKMTTGRPKKKEQSLFRLVGKKSRKEEKATKRRKRESGPKRKKDPGLPEKAASFSFQREERKKRKKKSPPPYFSTLINCRTNNTGKEPKVNNPQSANPAKNTIKNTDHQHKNNTISRQQSMKKKTNWVKG